MERAPMHPGDIRHVSVVEELDVDQAGRLAVVSRRVIVGQRYRSHLHVVDLTRHARPRRLTDGPWRDGSPRLAPDGITVAFIRRGSTDEPTPAALCVANLATGRVRTFRSRARYGSVSEVAWSPDGGRLAFVAEVDPPLTIVGRRRPVGVADREPVARRVTRADWRWDDEGHRDHSSHLFVVDAEGGEARQLTTGPWSVAGITWHPDGRRIAFSADIAPDGDIHPCTSIWSVGCGERPGRPRLALHTGAPLSRPAYSPDGRWLVAIGSREPDPLDDVSPGLVAARGDGSGEARSLTPGLDRPVGNWTDTDLHGWMVRGRHGPMWLDRSTVVAVVTDRGRSLPELWRLDPRTGEVVSGPSPAERTAPGPWADLAVHQMALAPSAPRGGRVIVLGTHGGQAMEVLSVDLEREPAERVLRTHTTFGSTWQRRFVQPEMRRLDVAGAGGPIEVWMASPPGAGDRPLATIVDVHGGPLGGWAPAPSNEVTMLIGAGYRVLLPNIRGSAGYGAGWIRPQLGDWGGVDVDDVHAVVDHAVAHGWSDPGRLGILGLSYGGFVVNWIVGTSDRFRAAVSENGVTNQISAWATSDSGPEYCRAALLGDPFSPEGIERLWRQSPLRHVAQVRTPLLMLQAEADLRCPASDNDQFFVALRHLGREVEYVLYPEEYHTYAVSGRPDRRIDRMERVMTWFADHL